MTDTPETPNRSTSTAAPPRELIEALQTEAQNQAESPWVQKLIQLLIDLLTGQPASLSESGNWTKTQTLNILGTTYSLAETLSGSVSITATPQ